ncbi:LRRN4 C-terminal-like protein [Alosa pseudoharengus]|uniref:LRRN4 C-terminal-like protein n=1 Tax=Alosa pseudoharengus TaxID=34774 RepID=UPI003F890876
MLIWNPTLLLLRLPVLLICLRESSSASDGPIHLVFDDYEETTTTPPDNKYHVTRSAGDYKICDYDLCVAQEESCQDIAAKMGCLCPGITPQTEPPHTPQVTGVSPAESGQVTVHWCAPFSFVSQYRVTVEGKEGQSHVFEGMSRNVTLAGIKVGQRVCVQAMNSAGVSSLSEESCSTYRLEKHANTPLVAGVIAGGLGFILLLTVTALILWRRKACCKGGTDNHQGLRNPSFSTDGTL